MENKLNYYSKSYGQVNICSNGFLSLTSRDASCSTKPLPNPAKPNAMMHHFLAGFESLSWWQDYLWRFW
jgi:hypothetical protein